MRHVDRKIQYAFLEGYSIYQPTIKKEHPPPPRLNVAPWMSQSASAQKTSCVTKLTRTHMPIYVAIYGYECRKAHDHKHTIHVNSVQLYIKGAQNSILSALNVASGNRLRVTHTLEQCRQWHLSVNSFIIGENRPTIGTSHLRTRAEMLLP
jgi:hypothetical protein